MLSGCGATSHGGDEGSETHWLSACDADVDCSQGQCLCGVCTVECDNAAECPTTLDVCEVPTDCATPIAYGVCGRSTSGAGDPGNSSDVPLDPGVPLDVSISTPELDQLTQQVQSVGGWDTQALLDAYPTSFEPNLAVDLSMLLNYDLLQASALALTETESGVLADQGLVIVERSGFATFSYGYRSVYAEDLPVLVTADSVLDAVHRSFDDILLSLEEELLIPTLEAYLKGMRSSIRASALSADVRGDADFFLAVAQSLLEGVLAEPAVPGSYEMAELSTFVEAARNAAGIQALSLFGVPRDIDLSQFKPRGHYTFSEELTRYFQAMMWLGRTDLRFLETQPDGSQVLRRQQVEIAFGLRDLMSAEQREQWELIDRIVTAFVGEHDYMAVPQLDVMQSALGIESVDQLSTISDEELAGTIIDGHYGAQRISSQVVQSDGTKLPLSASFALFGQRYVVDSHVFSQVTFSRAPRILPDPLDAAFAALGNNHAVHLLRSELDDWSYAPNLAGIRMMIDAQGTETWESSLYSLWLGALRELSPRQATDAEPTGPTSDGLPAVARTEPWSRRLLNTQLGSWAQLRHDTLLYAKQSYTDGSECEFPDAYVDPYPQFWSKLRLYAEHGRELVSGLAVQSAVLDRASAYLSHFADTVSIFERMAEHQLTGMPHSAEDLAFVNNAVRISGGGSGPPTIEGWYHQLLFNPGEFGDVDNVIADVHTDVGGEIPVLRGPSVLHVGTAYPRLMVTAIDTCEGPRVYAGPVFSFKQHLADGLTRLNEEEWQEMLGETPAPPDPEWLSPVVVGPAQ